MLEFTKKQQEYLEKNRDSFILKSGGYRSNRDFSQQHNVKYILIPYMEKLRERQKRILSELEEIVKSVQPYLKS